MWMGLSLLSVVKRSRSPASYLGRIRVVRTRVEHTCCKCCTVIKTGSQVYAGSNVLRGRNFSGQFVTFYWCEGCRKVESVLK